MYVFCDFLCFGALSHHRLNKANQCCASKVLMDDDCSQDKYDFNDTQES